MNYQPSFSTLGLVFLIALVVRYYTLQKRFNLIIRLDRHGKLPSWSPYVAPVLGHTLHLVFRPLNFFKSLKVPTRLCIPTANPFVIVGSNNIRKFFKTTPSSNPALVQKFVAGDLFGMPPSASATFINDNSGRGAIPLTGTFVEPKNRVCHIDHDIIQSMLKGEEAVELLHKLIECLYKRLDSVALSFDYNWMDKADLFEFYTANISPVVLEVFFGPLLTEHSPEFVTTFWAFDTWVAAIAKRAPRWLYPKGFRARENLIKSLVSWRQLTAELASNGDDTGAARGIMRKLELLKADDWDIESVAATDLGFIASFSSNPIPSLFWLNYEIFRDPELLIEMQSNCLACLDSASSTELSLRFDISALRNQPLLQSSIAEALRLRTHVFILRYPDEHDMHINEWYIPQKNLVMACSTTSHMDPTLWDTGPSGSRPLSHFWAERFLETPKDKRVEKMPRRFSSRGLEGVWMPFGGGEQMCPGQLFTKTVVSLATALMISYFDIEIRNSKKEAPVNWSHFGAGVIRPGAKIPFRIRRRC